MTIIELHEPEPAPIAYDQLQSSTVYKVVTGGQYQGSYVEKGSTGLMTIGNSSDGIDAVKDTLQYVAVYGISITN